MIYHLNSERKVLFMVDILIISFLGDLEQAIENCERLNCKGTTELKKFEAEYQVRLAAMTVQSHFIDAVMLFGLDDESIKAVRGGLSKAVDCVFADPRAVRSVRSTLTEFDELLERLGRTKALETV